MITVEGVPQAIARFAQLAVAASVARQQGVNAAAAQVAAAAQARAPVRTGALRDSITPVPDPESGFARVTAQAPHAGYVEFGTSDTPAQPFLRPAADSSRSGVIAAIAAALARVLR